MNKILVIDDDKISRRIVTKAVEGFGYIAIESGNGKHAWETLCENDDVSVIITDMKMPDMDGWELLHLVRRDASLKAMPVIMISGVVVGEVASVLGVNPESTFFLPKPLKVEDLKKILTQVRSFLT